MNWTLLLLKNKDSFIKFWFTNNYSCTMLLLSLKGWWNKSVMVHWKTSFLDLYLDDTIVFVLMTVHFINAFGISEKLSSANLKLNPKSVHFFNRMFIIRNITGVFWLSGFFILNIFVWKKWSTFLDKWQVRLCVDCYKWSGMVTNKYTTLTFCIYTFPTFIYWSENITNNIKNKYHT